MPNRVSLPPCCLPAIPPCLVAFLLVGFGSAAYAQDFTLPATGIIPNYDRVAIGQNEALEGGAYVARTNDAGANWYNPAGLALVDKVSLNAAASGYEVTRTALEGLGTETSRTRFSPVGRYFGLVVGNPVVKGDHVRIGLSFSRPVGWEPGVIESSFEFVPVNGGTETLGLSSLVSFSTSMPSLGAGFRLSERLRVGTSATLALTNLGVSQLLTDRYDVGGTFGALDRIFTIDGGSQQVILAGGVQWEPTANLRLGMQVRTPGLVLGGSATIVYERSEFGTAGVNDLVFRDDEATFRYKYPVNLVGGIAWVDSTFSLEVNLRYHGGTSPYDMFASTEAGKSVIMAPGGDPVSAMLPFTAVVQEARAVTNVAVGGSIKVSQGVRLHAGFFSDGSPVANEATSLFRAMDLYGGSIGASLAVGRLSGSLGFTGSAGNSRTRVLGPTLGGSSTETRIKVQNIAFIYALAYNF